VKASEIASVAAMAGCSGSMANWRKRWHGMAALALACNCRHLRQRRAQHQRGQYVAVGGVSASMQPALGGVIRLTWRIWPESEIINHRENRSNIVAKMYSESVSRKL
jgi:hypothetical protein